MQGIINEDNLKDIYIYISCYLKWTFKLTKGINVKKKKRKISSICSDTSFRFSRNALKPIVFLSSDEPKVGLVSRMKPIQKKKKCVFEANCCKLCMLSCMDAWLFERLHVVVCLFFFEGGL